MTIGIAIALVSIVLSVGTLVRLYVIEARQARATRTSLDLSVRMSDVAKASLAEALRPGGVLRRGGPTRPG